MTHGSTLLPCRSTKSVRSESCLGPAAARRNFPSKCIGYGIAEKRSKSVCSAFRAEPWERFRARSACDSAFGDTAMLLPRAALPTDALGYAYQHIQAGVQPLFVAGGVDSPITEGIVKGYTMIRALTQSWNDQPERASRPFSADRDGFVLAEGSWMFVLEEYVHAKARGARIYA